MKKYILLFLMTFTYFFLFGQGNIVVYHDSKPFTLIVNGIAQNMQNASNIKLTNIHLNSLDIEVRFLNGTTAFRTVMSTQGFEIVYHIRQNPTTQSPFIYFDKELPIQQSLTYQNQLIISYETVVNNTLNNNQHHHKNPEKNVIVIEQSQMETSAFQNAKNTIISKSHASSKMKIALQIVQNNYFSVNQVIEMARLFTFEDDKLEFVKAAYHKTINQNEFYLVNDVFTFSQSIDELNHYINKKP